MADQPGQAAAAAPAAPSSAPTPPAEVAPSPSTSAPPASPPTAPPAPPQSDEADPSQLYSFRGPDGQTVNMTLGQMVQAINTKRPEIPAEVLKNAELLTKAQSGDRDAILEMLGANAEPEAAQQPNAGIEQISALQQQVDELRASLGSVRPVVEQVSMLRDSAEISRIINDCQQQLPLSSRNPQAPGMVLQARNAILANLQQGGVDPKALTPEQSQRVLIQALSNVENSLQQMVQCYGITPDTIAKSSQAQQIVAEDDQTRGEDGVIPAKLRVQDGVITVSGQQVRQVPGGSLIPTDIPNPASSSGSQVGAGQSSSQMDGPTDRRGLLSQLRARRGEMEGGGQ